MTAVPQASDRQFRNLDYIDQQTEGVGDEWVALLGPVELHDRAKEET